jgi:hypothetical protein
MTSQLPDRKPNLSCGLLSLWVLGRQFPQATDHWDGNWLNVIAHCAGGGAAVTVSGPIIHLGELAALRKELAKMDEIVGGTAELPTMEPELHLDFACDPTGHIRVTCEITPDNLAQSHSFKFEIDQSYLGTLVRQCDQILKEHPVRDPDQKT